MSGARWLVLVCPLAVALAGCQPGNAGPDPGSGVCNLAIGLSADLVIGEPEFPDGGGPAPLCDRTQTRISNIDSCVCAPMTDALRPTPEGGLRTNLLDPVAQLHADRAANELFPGCKVWAPGDCTDDSCSFLTQPASCFQLGFINGFIGRSIGGVGAETAHDGDEHMPMCPFAMGVHDSDMPVTDKDIDLRALFAFRVNKVESYGRMDAEVQWCRWFGGPFSVAALDDPVNPAPAAQWDEFRPQQGERVSLVGDWFTDTGWTEIHETRIGATVRQDANQPDTWHLLTSGFFALDSAQQDELSVTVPVPGPTDPTKKLLRCLTAQPLSGGCPTPSWAQLQPPVADQVNHTCTIKVFRDLSAAPSDSTSAHFCGQTRRANAPKFQCPCMSQDTAVFDPPQDSMFGCGALGFSSFDSYDRCTTTGWDSNIFGPFQTDVVTRIAFAGDIRAMWVDPDDSWSCLCDCDDPARPGATITARVQGCASGGLRDDEDEDRATACEQACGGHVCGSAPACRIGACHARSVPEDGARLVGREGCDSAVPDRRVAQAADYRVDLDLTRSTVDVGTWDGTQFVSGLTTLPPVAGVAFLNDDRDPVNRRLEAADFQLHTGEFEIPQNVFGINVGAIHVSEVSTFISVRFAAALAADGTFVVDPGAMRLHVRAIAEEGSGGLEFLNAGPFTGSFDPALRTFSFDGIGRDDENRAVKLHLVGVVTNRPPVAGPGPDRTVECSSSTGTPVTLDASASTDPDPGDSIAHYQWFENGAGLSNQRTDTVVASLGAHAYELHVYDGKLGSSQAAQHILVADTTAPQVVLQPAQLCLWPPNHEFALLRLGTELGVQMNDACDASPTVRIASVTSNEGTDGTGAGNTAPDAVHGPTAACLRAERSATGGSRTYTLRVEARDATGNVSFVDVPVLVSHDRSSGETCLRATGLDAPDARCFQ